MQCDLAIDQGQLALEHPHDNKDEPPRTYSPVSTLPATLYPGERAPMLFSLPCEDIVVREASAHGQGALQYNDLDQDDIRLSLSLALDARLSPCDGVLPDSSRESAFEPPLGQINHSKVVVAQSFSLQAIASPELRKECVDHYELCSHAEVAQQQEEGCKGLLHVIVSCWDESANAFCSEPCVYGLESDSDDSSRRQKQQEHSSPIVVGQVCLLQWRIQRKYFAGQEHRKPGR